MASFLDNPNASVDVAIYMDEIGAITSAEISPARTKFISLVNQLNVCPFVVDDSTSIVLNQISGGITNALYIVTLSGAGEFTFVLRLFGFGTEKFIDRSVENIVFSTLSRTKQGPTFFGLFQTGRAEGFLPAMRSLQPSDMSQCAVYRGVASALAKLHTVSIPEVDAQQHNWVWNKILKFLDIAQAGDLSSRSASQREKFTQTRLSERRHVLHWLQRYFEDLQESITSDLAAPAQRGWMFGQRLALQRVLCHNDLLCGNIMIPTDTDVTDAHSSHVSVQLIDYEYAGYNYRAYDIANHFCEFGGFDFDIKNAFPAQEVRRDFIRHYLSSVLYIEDPMEIDEDIVAGFEDVVLRFTLVSHLFWGSWSVVQSLSAVIDFDYLSYSLLRFEAIEYHGHLFMAAEYGKLQEHLAALEVEGNKSEDQSRS